jgi:phosphomevalonate kinase
VRGSGTECSAPGKLVLLGEYGVLDGGMALVAAVDRRAVGRLGAGPATAPSAVVEAVLQVAGRRGPGPELPVQIQVDTQGFCDREGRKLGLGSSAACAVVSSALVIGSGGEDALEVAVEAHRAAFGGEGSGVDVAASYYGGVIASRQQPAPVMPLVSHLRDLSLFVLDTKRSASTAELVRACRASREWTAYTDVLKGLAGEGIRAWSSQSARAFLSIVARAGRAMAALGRSAGVEIVTEEIDAIMRVAEELGGAAKPSGAGGGDVAIAFGFDRDLGAKLAERTGTDLVDLAIDRRGLVRG